jgi:membrane protein YqaA with SNARE-associated domain
MIYKILTVVLLSSFEIYVAIASGMAFKLSPHVICIATLIGGISGVFIAAFLGDRIRAFIAKYRKPKVKKKDSTKEKLLLKLWHKYGVFGIGFVGTFLLGAPASIGIGYGFGVEAKQLVRLCLIAVVIRCVAYSYFFDYLKNLF